ncbi:MAG: homocysteine S-methyltransferase family protein [Fidelibacterota bacterium]
MKRKVLVGDGAMGTTLQIKGLNPGGCSEEWNLTHAEVVKQIYSDYYRAGSDFVETNTFGGSAIALEKYGFKDRVYEFNYASAMLARSVCPSGKFVAGSIGPTGEFIEPLGKYSFSQMKEVFREQVNALIEGGIDLIIIETMMDLNEAVAAISAVKEQSRVPVAATMTFELRGKRFKTMMGYSIREAVRGLEEAGADILGTNCGSGIEDVILIIEEMRSYTDKPLLAQPNAGIPELVDSKTVYRDTPEKISSLVPELIKAGANIVGGCCGTAYSHIRMIRKVVDNLG